MEALRIEPGASKLTESEVIKRILSGEKELFEILLRRNNQTLYRAVRSYVSDESEVKDLMQNTYLKSFEKLYQFKHDSTFSTWLIRIGINEALGFLRKKSRHTFISYSEEGSNIHSLVAQKGDQEMDPANETIRKELRTLLEKAIDTLEPNYKVVYVLREIEGMSTKQVSESLDITESNVKVRTHRAKSILKEKLRSMTRLDDLFEFGFSHCDKMVEEVMSQIL